MPPPFPMKPPMTPGGPMPAAPMLPKNPMGGPGGPGGSPMTSPGAGAGNEAAADSLVSAIMPTLLKAMQSYTMGSKKHQAVLNAYRALTANFAKQEGASQVPAAIQQLAMNARGASGGPMAGARPPGLMPAPAGPPPGGATPGGPPGGDELPGGGIA